MEDPMRGGRHDLHLASRKAEEAVWRRSQATQWLDVFVGPLGISAQPTESEFISCLRNGLVLCNAINKIQPGSVPKVVEIHTPSPSLTWDSQPLPAFQYFENVRNFLVAVEELKLPAFEASDIERDNLEVGSSAKVVDCVLALKAYYDWKQASGGNGVFKPPRSPLVIHSTSRIHSRASGGISSGPCRQLDMSTACNKLHVDSETQKAEDIVNLLAKAIAGRMLDAKENIDDNLLSSFRNGNRDVIKLFGTMMSSFLDEQLQNKSPEEISTFKDLLGRGCSIAHPTSKPMESFSMRNRKYCRACLRKDNCKHWHLFQEQGKELSNLKELLSKTKREFEGLQSQLRSDMKQIGNQVHELSTAALGYYKVVKENMSLYNMVQDLKGNIRVYCRIRPSFNDEGKEVVDFIGDDGSLIVQDPFKSQKEGRKIFQFNRIFGPTTTQEEVFKDTQPFIRSVMDGYNVCIFAYGQTGSGKTYTMFGPSGESTKALGINYLALNDLFQLSNRRKDVVKYDIRVQMVEIYNEQVRDLLAQDSSTTKYPFILAVALNILGYISIFHNLAFLTINKLEIRSCTSENGLSLPDATMHSVKSTIDVLNLMKLGEVNRAVNSTAINNKSSRSHSVLTVHVHGKDISGSTIRSCLHLVDLAGSERVGKSEVAGDGLKEAQYINKSLSCLGDVITALAQKSSHVPYRNSKLTLLLQNSLGGHAKTLMFAHVSPEAGSFGETISTLKFAQRVSSVDLGAASMNKESHEVIELKEQIESLKKALASKEGRRNDQVVKPKESRSPLDNPQAMTERTPPRSQWLSIEHCSAMKMEKSMNSVDRKRIKTPSVKTRSRRLSLEGPGLVRKEDSARIKLSEAVAKPLLFEALSSMKNGQLQDVGAAAKSHGHHNGVSLMDAHYQSRSPTSVGYKSSLVAKTDGRTKIPTLQLPKTPEAPKVARNKVQMMMKGGESNRSNEAQMPELSSSSTNGKGSQIRKSLRTIGKLINGSEKRNQQKLVEASPINGTRNICDARSPVSANARAQRRQSLTGGVQTSDRSRRSSLGGKSTDSCSIETRSSKTPPPLRPSAKTLAR
ncbi:kinesin-like protein KIN-14L isoform X2 [Diospyros lotus]|uniref:kinesin-like protein KIN-14L isoform X2 n=1 Tax=Diospyros lotus TaxID=55363 RepID=UPI00224D8314|nr:kinesin-like protein KIN-14L isoform X2 [Diospyros lotus]